MPAHLLQCLIYLALGKQVEKGRLLQLYRKAPFQGVVEDRVPGLVIKVGEHDGVLFRELRCPMGPPVPCAAKDGDRHQQYRGCGESSDQSHAPPTSGDWQT